MMPMPDQVVSCAGLRWLVPDWPVPKHVRAISSMRHGGYSIAPWQGLNLGTHVGDDPQTVAANRAALVRAAGLPIKPHWLTQVHGCEVAHLPAAQVACVADAACTSQHRQVCVVMTADCLPVLFSDQQGTQVAAAHAGWRGLCDGVLETVVANMRVPPADILAWFGPAISQAAFEVGGEVRAAFVAHSDQAQQAFIHSDQGRWRADLYLLARQRLQAIGLTQIYGGHRCTFNEATDFFSYRRDVTTGRMATMIWID